MTAFILTVVLMAGAVFWMKLKIKEKKYARKEKKSEPEPMGAALPDVFAFYKKKPLSEVEQILFWRLYEALPEHVILGQVQLSRFLGVKRGNNFNEWNNRINRMSVDFLVLDKTMEIVAAVELDDSSHEKPDRIEADKKKNKALADAGVKLVRWHVRSIPKGDAIRADLGVIESCRALHP